MPSVCYAVQFRNEVFFSVIVRIKTSEGIWHDATVIHTCEKDDVFDIAVLKVEDIGFAYFKRVNYIEPNEGQCIA